MTAPAMRAPWTIPLAQGPCAAWFDRTVATTVAVVVASVVAMLAAVTPDRRGHGTHEQLGLDPCNWPLVYGAPCPTCGCTTAACQLVHGQVLTAFATQPFGATMTLVAILLAVHAVGCLLRGRSFLDLMVRLPFWRLIGYALLLLLLAWGYKHLTWSSG